MQLEFHLNFLIGCSVTACIVLPQKSCGNKIPVPQSLSGDQPLAKGPEDPGFEISHDHTFLGNFWTVFRV